MPSASTAWRTVPVSRSGGPASSISAAVVVGTVVGAVVVGSVVVGTGVVGSVVDAEVVGTVDASSAVVRTVVVGSLNTPSSGASSLDEPRCPSAYPIAPTEIKVIPPRSNSGSSRPLPPLSGVRGGAGGGVGPAAAASGGTTIRGVDSIAPVWKCSSRPSLATGTIPHGPRDVSLSDSRSSPAEPPTRRTEPRSRAPRRQRPPSV